MRCILILYLTLLLSACNKNNDKITAPFIPKESDYHVKINFNGQDVDCWIWAGAYKPSKFGMVIDHYENGLLYELSLGEFPVNVPGSFYRLDTIRNNTAGWTTYSEMCCNEEPDQVSKVYRIFEEDSLSNYIRLNLDTVKSEATGMFKGTYINRDAPFDLVHIRCDTFYCKYSKQ